MGGVGWYLVGVGSSKDDVDDMVDHLSREQHHEAGATDSQSIRREQLVNAARSHAPRRHLVTVRRRRRHLLAVTELSMGPFCVTRSNPTHQLTDPTQPNPIQVKKNLDPTRKKTNNGA